MSPQFPNNVYNHLLVYIICVWMIYCTVHAASSEVNSSGIQCVDSERAALLHFKHDIRVDNCGLLVSWGDILDCCQWHGIHCSNRSGHVIGLRLPATDEDPDDDSYKACLEGTLSESLLELKHLKYLDLSLNNFNEQLPKFIGSLDALEHLNLSHAGFFGVVPQEIGNLSRLSSLDLNSEYLSIMRVKNLRWLSHLRLLKQLDLSGVDLSAAANMWLPIVNSLPFLQVLRLDDCQLSLELSSSLQYINSSSTLNVIRLSYNKMNDTSIFKWLSKLKGLDTTLQYLDLSNNPMFGNNEKVSGHAVQFLGSFCSLQTLFLLETDLHHDLSSIVQSFTVCPHNALATLDLSWNQVWGSIPDNINSLSSLTDLGLFYNQLNGTISQALWELSKLESLHLGYNSLKVVVTEEHLSNLSKLRVLDLGDNKEVVVNISANWIPPFQLDILLLGSCKVGPDFPMWLTTQKHLTSIDLYLSNNNLSQGLVPFLCPQSKMPLTSLDLSSNLFSDKIPDYWKYFDKLLQLNLSNNMLWGDIPTTIGALDKLISLQLGNNSISGQLPSSIINCKSLVILDISHNSLTGNIPFTIWDSFKNLSILMLGSNNFSGDLPSSFCQLSQIQILDLSNNLISGTIPRCISNLRGMTNTANVLETILSNGMEYGIEYTYDGAKIMWKGTERVFSGDSSLAPLKTIDFSNNTLEGQIPEGISSLIGLKSINLSNNHLSGAIPLKIGQLASLEILDLSRNHLLGGIPTSLARITALNRLNLSYNELSGRIPTGPQLQTFDNSTYMGNPELCGEPLPNCEGDKAGTIPENEDNARPHDEHHLDDFMLGLYISVVLGLITGFWGVFGSLALRRTWRHAFFRFCDDMKDKIYVVMVVGFGRVWRRT